MIPDSFIEELRYASDVERIISSYVSLKRKGRNLTGLCPFHSEKTPSFTVYPDSQSYYCFGCGNGGDVITFIRNIEHLEYVEALRFLAEKAGMALPEDAKDDDTARQKAVILEINRETARFYHNCLNSEAGAGALSYLKNRGLTGKTIKSFGLGYSPPGWDSLREHLRAKGYSNEEAASASVVTRGRNGGFYDFFRNRVMFPIIDLRGNVIGFGGRDMDGGGPKYLNSPDTHVFKKSRNLFALNFAKASKSDTLILGEGYMDVIAMHQAGFANAVATLGTSLTEEQSRLIGQYAKRVVIAYDSDSAGQAAAKRAINLFAKIDVTVGVLEIEGAKDPDEYIKKYGPQRFARLIDSGKSAIDFEISRLRLGRDLNRPEDAVAFLKDFCKLMAGIDNDIERSVYVGNVVKELEIDKAGVISTIDSLRKKKFAAARKKDAHNLQVYAQDNAGSRQGRRMADVGGLAAEDGLLMLLWRHPDYYGDIKDKLSPEDFLTGDNREIYAAMSQRLRDNQPTGISHFSQTLTVGQMSRLSGLIAKSRELRFSREQADEYIAAIKSRKDRKSADDIKDMSPEELYEYSLKQRKRIK